MGGSTDTSTALDTARLLATGDAAWKAVDQLAALWREARDGALGEQVCALGEELVPTEFSLRAIDSWTLCELPISGALLQTIIAHLRSLVAHDSQVEEFLRLVMNWSPDPRLGSLAIWVLSKDTARQGARQAAAELFLANADDHLRARLDALAQTTLPILQAEVAGIIECCKLPSAKKLPAPQLAAVAEVRESIQARLVEVREQIVRDVNLAIAEQQAVERQAAAKEEEDEQKKIAKTNALRAELAESVDRSVFLKPLAPTSDRLEAIVGSNLKEGRGDLWRFTELDAAKVRGLVAAGFSNLDDAPNDQPSVIELLGFLVRWLVGLFSNQNEVGLLVNLRKAKKLC